MFLKFLNPGSILISFNFLFLRLNNFKCPIFKLADSVFCNFKSVMSHLLNISMQLLYSIYYYGQESLRRNGVAIILNKRVQNAVLGCNLKNDRMISVHFQGKPFNITVIQAYALTSNAEEAEVE